SSAGVLSLPAIAPNSVELAGAPSPVLLNAAAYFCLLWSLGVGFWVFLIVRDFRRLRRLKAGCVPVDDNRLTDCMKTLAQAMGLRRAAALAASDGVAVPFLLGVRRPTIVFPSKLLQSGSDAIRLAMAHELAHMKRHELCWSWLLFVGEAVFFFHPLVWVARREVRLAQEIACDEIAMRATSTQAGEY